MLGQNIDSCRQLLVPCRRTRRTVTIECILSSLWRPIMSHEVDKMCLLYSQAQTLPALPAPCTEQFSFLFSRGLFFALARFLSCSLSFSWFVRSFLPIILVFLWLFCVTSAFLLVVSCFLSFLSQFFYFCQAFFVFRVHIRIVRDFFSFSYLFVIIFLTFLSFLDRFFFTANIVLSFDLASFSLFLSFHPLMIFSSFHSFFFCLYRNSSYSRFVCIHLALLWFSCFFLVSSSTKQEKMFRFNDPVNFIFNSQYILFTLLYLTISLTLNLFQVSACSRQHRPIHSQPFTKFRTWQSVQKIGGKLIVT